MYVKIFFNVFLVESPGVKKWLKKKYIILKQESKTNKNKGFFFIKSHLNPKEKSIVLTMN